ncbi:MAG: protein kinase [Deltaproteobacteria bacterium]|nr:protein kinase [Deltaproteobacteria bacterium]
MKAQKIWSHTPQAATAGTEPWKYRGSDTTTEGQECDFLSRSNGRKSSLVYLPDETILLDRFKIQKHLGDGRFASVYLAEDMLLARELALKIVEVGPCSESVEAVQLKREMDAYSKVSRYDNIIRVYDLHYVPWGGTGLLALTIDYAEGDTFRRWLTEHANDLDKRQTTGMDYFKQACRGVGSAHDTGIVHLDLKPENLLFSSDVLKVSDFGASRFAQTLSQTSTSHLDLPSFEVGTPAYMSPEHFTAPHPDDLDTRADIYSLGIILYELIHPRCRPPFGGSETRLKELHLTVAAPNLTETEESMACIIAKCLEKNPANRYQSVWELLDDLEHGFEPDSAQAIPEDSDKEETMNHVEEIWEKASLWFSEGDFTEASRLVEEVLGLEPEHLQARRLKEELETRFDQAKGLYLEIERGLDGGNMDQLVDLLKQAVAIYPDHPAGILVQTRLRSKTRQYREQWEAVSQCVSQQNLDEALNHLNDILRLYPEDSRAKASMEELKGRTDLARHFYQTVEAGLDKGENLNDLVKMAGEAAKLYPGCPEGRLVQLRLAGRSREFRKGMEKGLEALQHGAWEMALKWFCQVEKLCPNSIELEHIIERLSQIKGARQKINEALIQKRFHDAHHLAGIVDLQVQNLKSMLPILRND